MTEVIWKEPPPAARRSKPSGIRHSNKDLPYVAELMAKPGRWAYLGRFPNRSRGQSIARSNPGVEYTTRVSDDGQFDIYVRWNGETHV